jgi:hypothetical protein
VLLGRVPGGPLWPVCGCYGSRVKAAACEGRTTLKWRRSRVAMFTARNLSATARTMASAVPNGRSEYCSTRSTARLASAAVDLDQFVRTVGNVAEESGLGS